MDNDAAGRRAAQRAFWQITARHGNPQQASLPEGLDPADLLGRHGVRTLRDALYKSRPLAYTVIENTLDERIATQVVDEHLSADQTRMIGEAIGALPPDQWRTQIDHVVELVPASDVLIERAVIAAAERWTDEPRRQAEAQLGSPPSRRAPTSSASVIQPTEHGRAPTSLAVTKSSSSLHSGSVGPRAHSHRDRRPNLIAHDHTGLQQPPAVPDR